MTNVSSESQHRTAGVQPCSTPPVTLSDIAMMWLQDGSLCPPRFLSHCVEQNGPTVALGQPMLDIYEQEISFYIVKDQD